MIKVIQKKKKVTFVMCFLVIKAPLQMSSPLMLTTVLAGRCYQKRKKREAQRSQATWPRPTAGKFNARLAPSLRTSPCPLLSPAFMEEKRERFELPFFICWVILGGSLISVSVKQAP